MAEAGRWRIAFGKRLHKVAVFSFLILNVLSPAANALTVAAGLGMGTTTMTNETTETEGPLTQAFSVEKLFHSRLALGVEHLRSMTTGLITSASFTGLLSRYYINAAPMGIVDAENISLNNLVTRDYAFFVGLGFGSGQSSRLPNDVGLSSNAAGVYLSPRFGADYQLTRTFGLRGEAIYATTIVSKGQITQSAVGFSVYWML